MITVEAITHALAGLVDTDIPELRPVAWRLVEENPADVAAIVRAVTYWEVDHDAVRALCDRHAIPRRHVRDVIRTLCNAALVDGNKAIECQKGSRQYA